MRYYLDTNILYFTLTDAGNLSKEVRQIISDYSNILYTSSVCVMELMQILKTKPAKGKQQDPSKVLGYLKDMGVEVVYVKEKHLVEFSTTPALHSDPNDRLIIAQAASDKITLISSDSQFEQYVKYLPGFKFVLNRR